MVRLTQLLLYQKKLGYNKSYKNPNLDSEYNQKLLKYLQRIPHWHCQKGPELNSHVQQQKKPTSIICQPACQIITYCNSVP